MTFNNINYIAIMYGVWNPKKETLMFCSTINFKLRGMYYVPRGMYYVLRGMYYVLRGMYYVLRGMYYVLIVNSDSFKYRANL